jgi:hypothetical protein
VEAWHVVFGPQTLPHEPQFEESLVVSMHAAAPPSPPHEVRPAPHVVPHMLPVHVSPAAHLLPQPPQLFGSTVVSKQDMPHIVVPPPHVSAHAPCEQT